MKIILSKKNKEKYQSRIYQALIFLFAFFAIRYAYPHFFPYYANSYLTILIESDRVIVGMTTLVVLWFFIQTENQIVEKNGRISSAIMMCVNYVYFLPGLYMNMYYAVDFQYTVIYSMYCLIINLMVIWIGKREVRPAKHIFSKYDTENICLFLTVVMMGLSLFFSGFRINVINIFDSTEVYAARAENDVTARYSILWYFIIFGATIIPTWFVIALKKKQYFRALVYTVTILCMFNVSGNRQYVFTLVVAWGVYIFKNKKNIISWVFMIMWLIPVLELLVGKGYVLSDVLRRFVIVPNVDGAFHVDYFLEHQPDFLRQALNMYANRLGFVSPYTDKIATMIGRLYFGVTINANTGLVGGNFANYGYASLLLGPLGYVFSFWILDKLFVRMKYKEILLATAFTVCFSVTNYETWIELLIVPSWIFFYYVSLFFLPTQGLENATCKK